MSMELVGSFAGGIGLFLLGVRLMSDGLKMAAGRALRRVLTLGTGTPLRGLLSGIVITSLVQSSSAVTVATIGFVNAGLLSLLQTVYVIYGSNIGTTMTGWLVVSIGFNVSIKALALPLVGIGSLARLIGRNTRKGALGEAVAGFGLFFLGIDVLKDAFGTLGSATDLASLSQHGTIPVFVAVGVLLTFLMQSSSAAMAVILTAAAGNIISLEAAAATVIGANVGTTTTAAMAVLGATPNAQRMAATHVLFNLVTALIAMLFISPLLQLLRYVLQLSGDVSATTTLALFHTTFNVLGVLLMWPFTTRLVRWLEKRFSNREEALGRPQYLDRNVVATPALALGALALELGRMGGLVRTLCIGAMSMERRSGAQIEVERAAVRQLAEAVQDFTVEMQRAHLSEDVSAILPATLRVARYYTEASDLAIAVAEAQPGIGFLSDQGLAAEMADYRSAGVQLLQGTAPCADSFEADCSERLARAEDDYHGLKNHLLRAGAQGAISVGAMVAQLDQYSRIHRMLAQTSKGSQYLSTVHKVVSRYKADQKDTADEQVPLA